MRLIAREIGLVGNVTPHCLRHSAATWQMLAGTDIWQASRYLGMTVRTLEVTYAHHHPDFLEQATTAWTKHRRRASNNPKTTPIPPTERQRIR